MKVVEVTLTEWQRLLMPGRWLEGDEARATAARLTEEGRLEVRELRAGLELVARSYVGDVELGGLRVRIVPKLEPDALRSLLAFAHGTGGGRGRGEGPAEALAVQLLEEAEALWARGLAWRAGVRREALTAPRGRIDLKALASRGLVDASLPCEYAERDPDTALNQALRAGLELAARCAPSVAGRARSLDVALGRRVRRRVLDNALLREARGQLHEGARLYEGVLALIEALGRGEVGAGGALPSGFLFDMNRFFQAVVGRLLRGHLPGVELHEEWSLVGLLRYAPEANPSLRRDPTPRPDFAVFSGGKLQAILDAKYRDLWAEPLPREMLYQLAMYALGHGREAIIVYPSDDPYAREARVELRDPGGPWGFRSIVLRPLSLAELVRLAGLPPREARPRLEALARGLVAGAEGVR